jgi:ABC-type transporter Mla MlaB component
MCTIQRVDTVSLGAFRESTQSHCMRPQSGHSIIACSRRVDTVYVHTFGELPQYHLRVFGELTHISLKALGERTQSISPCIRIMDTVITACIERVDTVTLHALVKWTHLSACVRIIDTILTACIVRVDTVTLHAFREWRQSYCMRLESGKSYCMCCRQ